MPNFNTFHNIPDTDWQILGEFKLPVGLSTDDELHDWLSGVLDPLRLHAQFRNQIIRSAQRAAGRAMRSERSAEFRHLHFFLYAPQQLASDGKTWGFFQIEKRRDHAQGENLSDQLIEYYLYLEA